MLVSQDLILKSTFNAGITGSDDGSQGVMLESPLEAEVIGSDPGVTGFNAGISVLCWDHTT